jgi:hypothetical protein
VGLGSRVAFAAWRLYRTSGLARRALDSVIRRSAIKTMARHDAFVDAVCPRAPWSDPRPTPGGPLRVVVAAGEAGRVERARLFALLNHWDARYEVSTVVAPPPFFVTLEPSAASPGTSNAPAVTLAFAPDTPPLEQARELLTRVHGENPRPGLRAHVASPGKVILDVGVLAPRFAASPWGSVLPDAIDRALCRADWRTPLEPLVSARVDDVTGAAGLGWLAAFEEAGIQPSVGTLHDVWMRAGKDAVNGLVAASRRGVSVSPHAFDMDTFIWYFAPGGRPFTAAAMEAHRHTLARDLEATGLVLGKTLNAHFDVIGDSAAATARALGFRYVLGEHELSQDWREGPRGRDPIGTPLYSYGPLGHTQLFGVQAGGAIASSATPGSRYDWLRNFLAVDGKTNRPTGASLDRSGAVRQGVGQILSALHAGFPAYLLTHEVHLDALGRDGVAELLDKVLGEVRARVPNVRVAAFDELPAACEAHLKKLAAAPHPA